MELPRIFFEGGAWLVWTAEEVEILKVNAKVMGSATMTSPWYNHQHKSLALPFEFTDYEALWCAQNGFCKLIKPIFKNQIQPIENSNYKTKSVIELHTNSEFDEEQADLPTPPKFKYEVFCNLKKYGYTVGDGTQYACDFAVYRTNPWECHSSALVWCVENDFDTRKLISWVRIADGAKKHGIAAIETKNQIKYLEFNRFMQKFPPE